MADQKARHRTSVQQFAARMLAAPFATRMVSVDRAARGQRLLGRIVEKQESSLVAHLAKRVWAEGQWAPRTTTDEYLGDLRAAIAHVEARFVRYQAEDGRQCIGCFAPNVVPAVRRGAKPESYLWVVYDVDRDRIVTGHMVSSIDVVETSEGATWLT
jgi:hypothetical protein